MIIPTSCQDIINRERINDCCEPNLEGMPLRQQVRYFQGSCSYLVTIIVRLLRLIREMEQATSQAPSGGSGA